MEDIDDFDVEALTAKISEAKKYRMENWNTKGIDFYFGAKEKVHNWLFTETTTTTTTTYNRIISGSNINLGLSSLRENRNDSRIKSTRQKSDDSDQSVDTAQYILSNKNKKSSKNVAHSSIKQYLNKNKLKFPQKLTPELKSIPKILALTKHPRKESNLSSSSLSDNVFTHKVNQSRDRNKKYYTKRKSRLGVTEAMDSEGSSTEMEYPGRTQNSHLKSSYSKTITDRLKRKKQAERLAYSSDSEMEKMKKKKRFMRKSNSKHNTSRLKWRNDMISSENSCDTEKETGRCHSKYQHRPNSFGNERKRLNNYYNSVDSSDSDIRNIKNKRYVDALQNSNLKFRTREAILPCLNSDSELDVDLVRTHHNKKKIHRNSKTITTRNENLYENSSLKSIKYSQNLSETACSKTIISNAGITPPNPVSNSTEANSGKELKITSKLLNQKIDSVIPKRVSSESLSKINKVKIKTPSAENIEIRSSFILLYPKIVLRRLDGNLTEIGKQEIAPVTTKMNEENNLSHNDEVILTKICTPGKNVIDKPSTITTNNKKPNFTTGRYQHSKESSITYVSKSEKKSNITTCNTIVTTTGTIQSNTEWRDAKEKAISVSSRVITETLKTETNNKRDHPVILEDDVLDLIFTPDIYNSILNSTSLDQRNQTFLKNLQNISSISSANTSCNNKIKNRSIMPAFSDRKSVIIYEPNCPSKCERTDWQLVNGKIKVTEKHLENVLTPEETLRYLKQIGHSKFTRLIDPNSTFVYYYPMEPPSDIEDELEIIDYVMGHCKELKNSSQI